MSGNSFRRKPVSEFQRLVGAVSGKGRAFDMNRREIVEEALRILAPRAPDHEFESIVDHALASAGLRSASPENAAWLSMVAYIRHRLTDYDSLLQEGYDQDSARFFVAEEMNRILAQWGSPRRVAEEE